MIGQDVAVPAGDLVVAGLATANCSGGAVGRSASKLQLIRRPCSAFRLAF